MKSPSELFSVRIIYGVRYYVCKVCGKKYISRSSVRQHIKIKHLRR